MVKFFFKSIFEILNKKQSSHAYILLFLMLVGFFLEFLNITLLIPILSLLSDKSILNEYPIFTNIIDRFSFTESLEPLIAFISIFFIIFILKTFFLLFLMYQKAKFVADLKVSLSQQFFKGYLNLPYLFHTNTNSAALIRNILSETGQFTTGIIFSTLSLFLEIGVALIVFLVLIFINPLGALISFSTLLVCSVLYLKVVKKYVNKKGKERQVYELLRLKNLNETLGSIRDIKLYNKEKFYLSIFYKYNLKSIIAIRNSSLIISNTRYLFEVIIVTVILSYILIQLNFFNSFENLIFNLGILFAALLRLAPSANKILSNLNMIFYSFEALKKLQKDKKVFSENTNNDLKNDVLKLKKFKKIKFDGVSFFYDQNENKVLENVNFEINNSDFVGIYGQTGSGKSTLVDLFCGLINPTSGKILVNDEELKINSITWQKNIGYVSQKSYLLDDTIKNNIAFTNQEIGVDVKNLEKSIDLAQLNNFISKLEKGSDTVIGEQGVRLSGGQRQRIGIARAIYRDASILILDEPTTGLDRLTSQNLLNDIVKLKGKKTIIIVSHDLSFLNDCNIILEIKDNSLVVKQNI